MDRAQVLANHFFREYQEMSTPEKLEADMKKWQAGDFVVWTLPLAQQAEYADYVTTRMCQQDVDTVVAFARLFLAKMSGNEYLGNNSCNIGNVARMIITLPEGSDEKRALADFLDRGRRDQQLCVVN